MTESLAEAFPKEQERCRELLKFYQEIPTGKFGAIMIEASLKEAEQAITGEGSGGIKVSSPDELERGQYYPGR